MSGLYDNHNHCQFSFDGKRTTVEKTARSADSRSLAGLCFTDHMDFYTPPMKADFEELVPEEFDVKQQQAEIDRVQALLRSEGSKLRIFKGIEIGVYRSCRDKIAELISSQQFDEIIASVHYLDDTDPYWGGYYGGKTWKEAYGHYLETLYEEMVWLSDRFDIMGHYDYITRYAPYPQASIFYKDFPDIMDSILKYLAQNGKALELNTKTYQPLRGRTPQQDPDILKRFRELGGEAVSMGSDSHDAERVGFHFDIFSDYLKTNGFKRIAHFEQRKLVFSDL